MSLNSQENPDNLAHIITQGNGPDQNSYGKRIIFIYATIT